MRTKKYAIIGASGFIGSSLVKHLVDNNATLERDLILISRRGRGNGFIAADHLDYQQIKRAISNAQVIFNTAGLTRQQTTGTNQLEVLIEQLMQNTISAIVVSHALEEGQELIWTTTNAVDTFLSLLSTEEEERIEKLLTYLKTKVEPERMEPLEARLIVLKGIKEYLREFKELLQAYSYPFSKYLGQRFLQQTKGKKIKIVRISDVYGPGQDISPKVINPLYPARRIQRFVAAYKMISEGEIDWIPQEGKILYGFYRKKGKIVHQLKKDFVYPTYIGEVCRRLVRISKSAAGKKTFFDESGEKMTNQQMVMVIRNFFHVDVRVKQDGEKVNPVIFLPAQINLRNNLTRWIL